MTPTARLALLLPLLAVACGDSAPPMTAADLAAPVVVDLATPPDAGAPPDEATPPDLAMPDLSMSDLAMPDLAMPDLARASDLAAQDLAQPDLSTADLAPAPDLSQPDLATPDLAAAPDLSPAADLTPCGNSLSNVGSDDFSIEFTLTTSSTAARMEIMNQRATCDISTFWEIRLFSGKIGVEVDQNGNPDSWDVGARNIADGLPHDILVSRVAGNLYIIIDGALDRSAPGPEVLGALPPLALGSGPCVGVDGTVALSGAVANVCTRD